MVMPTWPEGLRTHKPRLVALRSIHRDAPESPVGTRRNSFEPPVVCCCCIDDLEPPVAVRIDANDEGIRRCSVRVKVARAARGTSNDCDRSVIAGLVDGRRGSGRVDHALGVRLPLGSHREQAVVVVLVATEEQVDTIRLKELEVSRPVRLFLQEGQLCWERKKRGVQS